LYARRIVVQLDKIHVEEGKEARSSVYCDKDCTRDNKNAIKRNISLNKNLKKFK